MLGDFFGGDGGRYEIIQCKRVIWSDIIVT
jgi:hypothetical protein